jgi:hypothetical protein
MLRFANPALSPLFCADWNPATDMQVRATVRGSEAELQLGEKTPRLGSAPSGNRTCVCVVRRPSCRRPLPSDKI